MLFRSDATYNPFTDGQYRVQLNVEAQKLITTDLGQQTTAPLEMPVAIALQNQAGEVIYEAEHTLNGVESTVEVTVSELPVVAAVDGDYTLPSSFLPDNTKPVRPLED